MVPKAVSVPLSHAPLLALAAALAVVLAAVVLVPLAAAAASVVIVIVAAVCWMGVVHKILTRLGGREAEDDDPLLGPWRPRAEDLGGA